MAKTKTIRLWALLGRSLIIAVVSASFSLSYTVNSSEAKSPTSDLNDTNTLLGSYLAGRVARSYRDNENAAVYYQRALARDPANQQILDDAFQIELAAGHFDSARGLAQKLIKRRKDDIIASIFLGLDAFKRKDYARAEEYFRSAERSSPGEPTIKLARAWVLVAQGKAERALALLQTPSKATWAVHFESVQKAFLADVGKQKQAAAQAYKAIYEKKQSNTRVGEAFARHLAFWGDKSQARAVLEESGAKATPMGKLFLADLDSGKPTKLMVSTVDEGMGEVFLGIGQVLATNNGVDAAQIYFQLALFLNQSSDIAQLETAEVLGTIEKYEKATQILSKIKDSSPFWLNAQIRKALHLNAMQKPDEALALLRSVREKQPKEIQLLQTMASIESSRKKFAEAIPYYDEALALVGTIEKKHWQLFYARGIAYERTKQWSKAEADFKKALELDPDQAGVLNYLGYSWIDQNINVPEAFELIKKAVKLRPNDGHIVDSLGWAYYIMKDYPQALKHLERAVELMPGDPTLNDHLGDVYWRLGRKLEAQFQWAQALTLTPEPDDEVKIRRKIETGNLPDEPGANAERTKTVAGDAASQQQ